MVRTKAAGRQKFDVRLSRSEQKVWLKKLARIFLKADQNVLAEFLQGSLGFRNTSITVCHIDQVWVEFLTILAKYSGFISSIGVKRAVKASAVDKD